MCAYLRACNKVSKYIGVLVFIFFSRCKLFHASTTCHSYVDAIYNAKSSNISDVEHSSSISSNDSSIYPRAK